MITYLELDSLTINAAIQIFLNGIKKLALLPVASPARTDRTQRPSR